MPRKNKKNKSKTPIQVINCSGVQIGHDNVGYIEHPYNVTSQDSLKAIQVINCSGVQIGHDNVAYIEHPYNVTSQDSLKAIQVINCSGVQIGHDNVAYIEHPYNVTSQDSLKGHMKPEKALQQSGCMLTARQHAVNKSEAAVTAALQNVYFAAKNNLANTMVASLNELCIQQGAAHLKYLNVDKHTTYEHTTSILEFQQSLVDVLYDDMKKKLRSKPKYCLMFDESTDISVKQNIATYIRFLETDAFGIDISGTYFLSFCDLERANADTIYRKILALLLEKGLDISNLCGVCTDGAAVMVGSTSGVVTRVKKAVPGLIATHCIAHRLALSCSGGADCIPYLVTFQEILNSVYKYFHNFPQNMARLSAIHAILNSHSSMFKESCFHTSWLSFEGSVSALVKNYSSLLSVFLEESSAKALSLYKPISTYKFLYVAHFLTDVLEHLAILSQMYQKKNLCYSEIEPLLRSTISSLESLKDNRNGATLSSFVNSVPSVPELDQDGLYTFSFHGHTIRDSFDQRKLSLSVCDQFVDNMILNLNKRFSNNEDSLIMKTLSSLFNPLIPDNKVDVNVVSDYLGKLGFDGRVNELNSFLKFSRAFASDPANSVLVDSHSCARLALRNRSMYPAVAEVAERFLIVPVSTAECERGFSKQNLIKTTLRNCLSTCSLKYLMKLSIDGPPVADFPYFEAFKIWSGKKTRRILD